MIQRQNLANSCELETSHYHHLPVTFNESLNFSWPWFYEMENWGKIYT